MQVTTMHTLTFTVRSGHGKHQLAKDIIEAGASAVGVNVVKFKSLPLPEGEDVAIRTTEVQVQSDNLDKLTVYWNSAHDALYLVGVEATSP